MSSAPPPPDASRRALFSPLVSRWGALRAKASAFDHPKAPHADALAERPFTSAVQILIPRGSSRAGPLTDVSGALRLDSDVDGASVGAHVVAELTLADLLDEAFLARHVRARAPERKSAGFRAVCVDGRIDRDDVAALLPDGRLVLSLTPETYRRFGVPGARSDRGTLKYRCEVNLAAKTSPPARRSGIDWSSAREPSSTPTPTPPATSTSAPPTRRRRRHRHRHRHPHPPAIRTKPATSSSRRGAPTRRGAPRRSPSSSPSPPTSSTRCSAGDVPPNPPTRFSTPPTPNPPPRRGTASPRSTSGSARSPTRARSPRRRRTGRVQRGTGVGGGRVIRAGGLLLLPLVGGVLRGEALVGGASLPLPRGGGVGVRAGAARTRPGCEWAAVTLWGFAADPTAGVGGGPDGGRRGDAGGATT